MKKLREVVQAKLLTLATRVYFQTAPQKATFPYVVFDFPTSIDDGEEFQSYVLDVDGWDNPVTGDTTALETLMAAVNSGINKTTITTADLGVTFWLDNKLSIIDDDIRIKRRKYIYQARVWEVK